MYLHPSDPDVNHVDLLTSLLIVYCFSVDFFYFFLSGFFLPAFLNCRWCTGACLFARVGICVCLGVCLY